MGIANDDVSSTPGGLRRENEEEAAAAANDIEQKHEDSNKNGSERPGKQDKRESSTAAESNVTAAPNNDLESPSQPPPMSHTAENVPQNPKSTPRKSSLAPKPPLQSSPTLAVSRTDIHTQSHQGGTRENFETSAATPPSGKSSRFFGSIRRYQGISGSDTGDTASVKSYVPASEAGGDAESLLGDVLGAGEKNSIWKLFKDSGEDPEILDESEEAYEQDTADFQHEFDPIFETDQMEDAEKHLISQWRSKRKHFLILSSAGKPIYSRHGSDGLISSVMGTIQTIISFFEGTGDQLRAFSTGDTRFVILSQGPLYLVGVSRLSESDAQLRAQLEALYMQILSTLTLPTLKQLFTNRPSTDLRRPLKGTEVLLSSLADAFTRGSPSALLSSLECLRLKRSDRKTIDDAMLKTRGDSLLYGLIVAGGRLVSVVRPRKHSLHAGDLQLIFNMLFEADGIKEGGGENWVPLCLPAFNQNGYLYMYVSFVPAEDERIVAEQNASQHSDFESSGDIAILLLSSKKESFYELRTMRDDLVAELVKNGSLSLIKSALAAGRPSTTDIIPGTVLRHFLYKSRSNVQFVMPSYEPDYTNMLAQRRLLSVYHKLQASVHSKNAHLNVKHCVGRNHISLAWVNPTFELYCVAAAHASRSALAQSANKVVQWVRQEEQRVFIIGGGVF